MSLRDDFEIIDSVCQAAPFLNAVGQTLIGLDKGGGAYYKGLGYDLLLFVQDAQARQDRGDIEGYHPVTAERQLELFLPIGDALFENNRYETAKAFVLLLSDKASLPLGRAVPEAAAAPVPRPQPLLLPRPPAP